MIDDTKYCIRFRYNEPQIELYYNTISFLAFKTYGKAELFLKNHRDLIKITKPLS